MIFYIYVNRQCFIQSDWRMNILLSGGCLTGSKHMVWCHQTASVCLFVCCLFAGVEEVDDVVILWQDQAAGGQRSKVMTCTWIQLTNTTTPPTSLDSISQHPVRCSERCSSRCYLWVSSVKAIHTDWLQCLSGSLALSLSPCEPISWQNYWQTESIDTWSADIWSVMMLNGIGPDVTGSVSWGSVAVVTVHYGMCRCAIEAMNFLTNHSTCGRVLCWDSYFSPLKLQSVISSVPGVKGTFCHFMEL